MRRVTLSAMSPFRPGLPLLMTSSASTERLVCNAVTSSISIHIFVFDIALCMHGFKAIIAQ